MITERADKVRKQHQRQIIKCMSEKINIILNEIEKKYTEEKGE